MIENILSGLLIVISLIVGITYVCITKKATRRKGDTMNRQEFVKLNRKRFGASNRGASMDGRTIYVIDSARIGF